ASRQIPAAWSTIRYRRGLQVVFTTLPSISRSLWNGIVRPVVQVLRQFNSSGSSTVRWCLTRSLRISLFIIFLTFTSPLTPPTLATLIHARGPDCRSLEMRPSRTSLPSVKSNPDGGKALRCISRQVRRCRSRQRTNSPGSIPIHRSRKQ
ncbi:hypothetical protein DFH29DRAFT_1016584, partial [Suillus ampliporus]